MEDSKTRELVREIGTYAMMALVLICTCLYFLYSWQTKKQEREDAEARVQLEQQQRELKRREDQLKREQERLERERELAERRLKEEKRREEERARKLAREKAAAERREAERKQRTARCTPMVERRMGVLEQFATGEGFGKTEQVRVDWWKNCPKDERPDQARHPMTYRVLTFGQTEEGWTCAGFEVTAEKGNPHARVVRLPREDGAEEQVSVEDFGNLLKNSIQLVRLGRFCYLRDDAFASKGKIEHGSLDMRLEVADLYYRGLQRLLKEVRIVLPEVRVGVLFDPRDDAKTRPFSVGEFSGRETLTDGPVLTKIRQYLEWRAKREMAQETESRRPETRKRVPRKPRVTFAPEGKLTTNVRKNIDGSVVVSREFHGAITTTAYKEWVKWMRIAEKEEERYQAECEALSRVTDEPVRKPKPQPRAVSDADVRAAFERGILSWQLL